MEASSLWYADSSSQRCTGGIRYYQNYGELVALAGMLLPAGCTLVLTMAPHVVVMEWQVALEGKYG